MQVIEIGSSGDSGEFDDTATVVENIPVVLGIHSIVIDTTSSGGNCLGNDESTNSHDEVESSIERLLTSSTELPRFVNTAPPSFEAPTGTDPKSIDVLPFSSSIIGTSAYQSSCATLTGPDVKGVVNCRTIEWANG